MLFCAMNLSEGRDEGFLAGLEHLAGRAFLDRHTSADHNRSVITIGGPEVLDAAFSITQEAVANLDIRRHEGAHPRLGVVDVVPFVPVEGTGESLADAVKAREAFAVRASEELGVPVFSYGVAQGQIPSRELPVVRKEAFKELLPDWGPRNPHPTAGAICAGARPPLVAYNLWLDQRDIEKARTVVREIRSRLVRALAFELAEGAQVSLNLVAPFEFGPAQAYDFVSERASVRRCELVGLIPARVLEQIEPDKWGLLDLGADKTLEFRLREQGYLL